MKLIGHTVLKINGKVALDKKNDITTWVYRATQEGNFQDILAPTKHQPLSQFFDGCLLLSSNIDLSEFDSVENAILPSDAVITAMAGDDDGSQSGNLKRGSRDLFTNLANGIERRWSWTENKGNGTIGCVCLTRALFGKAYMADIYNDSVLVNENVSLYEILSVQGSDHIWYGVLDHETDTDKIAAFTSINLIDWEKELGYSVAMAVDSHDIRIKSYKIATKYSHLSGNMCSVLSATPVDDVTLTTDITFGTVRQCSFSYVGDRILVINGSETNTLTIFDIDTTNWTMEKSVHNFSGKVCTDNTPLYYFNENTFTDRVDATAMGAHAKDCYPMLKYERTGNTVTAWECLACINGYGNDSRLVRVNLVNNTIIETYDNILRGEANEYWANHAWIILPNGDAMRHSVGNLTGVYYSPAKQEIKAYKYNSVGNGIQGFMGSVNGTILIKNGDLVGLFTTFPYISTVNNLDELVTKRVGDQMELIYQITEVEESDDPVGE